MSEERDRMVFNVRVPVASSGDMISRESLSTAVLIRFWALLMVLKRLAARFSYLVLQQRFRRQASAYQTV
jgi:hypothetical protein